MNEKEECLIIKAREKCKCENCEMIRFVNELSIRFYISGIIQDCFKEAYRNEVTGE